MLCIDEELLGKHKGISSELLSNAMTVGFFSVWESRRLYGLIVALQASCELFEGNVQAARAFLRSPLRCFNSKTSLKMLITEEGASAVVDLIGRLSTECPPEWFPFCALTNTIPDGDFLKEHCEKSNC